MATLTTVGDVVKKLQEFPQDKMFVLDLDGDTSPIESGDVSLWDEDDPESAVAIFVGMIF